jgi:hypothetical protein
MVHASMLVITTDSEHLTYGRFSQGETICFGSWKFIANCFDILSLYPMGNDSSIVFVGTACSRSLSMHPIIENPTDEFYTTPGREGSSDFPIFQRHSIGTMSIPITTTPWPEDASTPQTIATVLPRAIVPQPNTSLSHE